MRRDRFDDITEGEGVLLFRHPGMIDHLQQEIAELVPEIVEIAARDRVRDFVGFLDGIGRDGRKILFEVPGTARHRRAQLCHDLDQA